MVKVKAKVLVSIMEISEAETIDIHKRKIQQKQLQNVRSQRSICPKTVKMWDTTFAKYVVSQDTINSIAVLQGINFMS